MPADPIQAMEFAQSKGQARKEGTTGISFEDVAGLSYIQEELQDIVSVGMRAPMALGFCDRLAALHETLPCPCMCSATMQQVFC